MRKSLVVIFLLSMLSTQAQELNFWQKANNMLTKFKNIDSTYVYQPKQGFTLGLFSSIQRVGIDVTAMFDINYDDLTLPGSSKYSLREGVSPKIGLELGYGKLVLGYGVEVGPKRAYKKQAFGLNLLGKSWGLHFNYFNLSNRFKTNIEIGEEGQDNYHTEEILSKDPAKSANFVCWHKDPTNLRDKGLRNVTINLTALPVITAVNYSKVKDFEYDDESVFEDEVVSENYYYPMPNFVGSTAIAMTLDRFFISTQFVYNCFYFRSSDAFKFNDLQISSQVNDLSFRGYFHDWKVKLLFTYKF